MWIVYLAAGLFIVWVLMNFKTSRPDGTLIKTHPSVLATSAQQANASRPPVPWDSTSSHLATPAPLAVVCRAQ